MMGPVSVASDFFLDRAANNFAFAGDQEKNFKARAAWFNAWFV